MLESTISQELEQLIASYLDSLRCINYSPGTIEGYGNNLHQFVRLLSEIPHSSNIKALAEACSEEYLLDTVLQKKNNRPDITACSIRRYMCAWRSFIKHLVAAEILDVRHDRFRYALPKLPETLPKAVSMTMLTPILDSNCKNWIELRNQCMFELMSYSGLRISEVINLKLTDIELAQLQTRVTGKGNKTRMVPITPRAANKIQQYMQARGRIHARSDYLFIARHGSKLSSTTIRKHLGTAMMVHHGEKTRLSPHQLRHSCATHFLKETHNLRFIQLLLGHQSIATTQVYTHLDMEFVGDLFHKNHDRQVQVDEAAQPAA